MEAKLCAFRDIYQKLLRINQPNQQNGGGATSGSDEGCAIDATRAGLPQQLALLDALLRKHQQRFWRKTDAFVDEMAAKSEAKGQLSARRAAQFARVLALRRKSQVCGQGTGGGLPKASERGWTGGCVKAQGL